MKNTFRMALYVVGIFFDVAGLLIAVISQEFGLKLGGIVLVVCGVAIMKLSGLVRSMDLSGTSNLYFRSKESPTRKPYRLVLSTILLAIILSGAVWGIFIVLHKHEDLSSIFFPTFCIGIVLLTFILGVSMKSKDNKIIKTKDFKSNERYKFVTSVQVLSVVIGILSFFMWRINLFHAVKLGWPLYLIGICSTLFVISTSCKIYSLIRNMRLR